MSDELEALRFQELLPLAEVWARAQARQGVSVPAMVLAQDPAFIELCTTAARLGHSWADGPHEHWCGMQCEHNVDDIRSDGYAAAARDVESELDDESGLVERLRAWVRSHLGEPDGGDNG